jgi:hypothetical protein
MPQEIDPNTGFLKPRTFCTFERFPEQMTCPLCHLNDNKPCVLVPIAGQDGQTREAIPIHAICLENHWQWSRDLNALIALAPRG